MPDETGYTYEDAARLCGVSSETIRQRARRGSIRRGRRTNSGRPTVLLTEDELRAIRGDRPVGPDAAGRDRLQPDDRTVAQPVEQPRPDEAAELVELLRDQLARAEARADRAEVREVETRTLLERQGREVTAALVRTAMAETEARMLREAMEEARRPWVARVVRAWRRSER